eukprot:gene39976-54053_t
MANFEMVGIDTLSYADWIPMFLEGAANWINGECENFTSLGPFNISIAFTCSVCKRGTGESCTLKRCTGCLVNTYCSKVCQMKDHPVHKKFCKMVRSMRLTELDISQIPRSTEQWKLFLLYNFTSDPEDSFHFQFLQHCSVCYATPFFSNSRDVKLSACSKCHLAHRCSRDECARVFADCHDEVSCEKFYIARAALVMNMQQGNMLSVNSRTRVSVPLPSSWVSYFHSRPTTSVSSSSQVIKEKIKDFSLPMELLEMPPVMATLTHNLSFSMTILHSLQLIHSTEKLLSFQEMEIHVLGAAAYETCSAINRHEEIFHWLPNLRRMKICYIGPTLQQRAENVNRFPGKFCRSCEAVGCSCEVVLLRGLYHDLQGSDEAPVAKADLVIACNSGIHDHVFKSSWYPSLQLLVSARKDSPIAVFTAYADRETGEQLLAIIQPRRMQL